MLALRVMPSLKDLVEVMAPELARHAEEVQNLCLFRRR